MGAPRLQESHDCAPIGGSHMSSRALRWVSVLLSAAAISGVATAVASAEGPVWLVNGVELEAGKTLNAVGKGTLFFSVAGLSLRIECAKLVEKMVLKGGGPGTCLLYTSPSPRD